MSFSIVQVKRKTEPVSKPVEEKCAKEYFFTELDTTATCLICKQKVLFKEFNMKRHYDAKHAEKYNPYQGQKRKMMYDQLQREFNGLSPPASSLKREDEFKRYSAGTYSIDRLFTCDRCELLFWRVDLWTGSYRVANRRAKSKQFPAEITSELSFICIYMKLGRCF